MDKKQLFASITGAVISLKDAWAVKLIASFLVAAICNLHVQLLLIFAGIVIVDLLTKWFALAEQYLNDNGKPCGAWECFKAMPAARRAGYIRSDVMKHRFVGKIGVYMVLVFGAAMVDLCFKTLQKPEFLVALVVGYLMMSELLSIVENFQEAGVKEAEKLHELIEKKGSIKL